MKTAIRVKSNTRALRAWISNFAFSEGSGSISVRKANCTYYENATLAR